MVSAELMIPPQQNADFLVDQHGDQTDKDGFHQVKGSHSKQTEGPDIGDGGIDGSSGGNNVFQRHHAGVERQHDQSIENYACDSHDKYIRA